MAVRICQLKHSKDKVRAGDQQYLGASSACIQGKLRKASQFGLEHTCRDYLGAKDGKHSSRKYFWFCQAHTLVHEILACTFSVGTGGRLTKFDKIEFHRPADLAFVHKRQITCSLFNAALIQP
jgi:hypothetical protein